MKRHEAVRALFGVCFLDSVIDAKDLARLRKAGYAIVGEHAHSAVKPCTWTKNSLCEAHY